MLPGTLELAAEVLAASAHIFENDLEGRRTVVSALCKLAMEVSPVRESQR
jgi:hypothetical protein